MLEFWEGRRQNTEDRRMKQLIMEYWNVGIPLEKVIPLILFILSRKITVILVHSVRKSSFSKISNQKSEM